MPAIDQLDLDLPRWLVVGFSGHRNLQHPEQVKEKIVHALNQLTLRNPRLSGVCSAASGADTLFAEEMLRRDCPISVVLPFSCDSFKDDFKDDPAGWERSQELMRRAIAIDIVHQSETDQLETLRCAGVCPTPEKDDVAPQAYMEAGYQCIDHADVLLAVWNEKEGKGFGGTADAVHYAIQIGMPLIIINPETGKVTNERLPEPVHAQIEPTLPVENSREIVERYFKRVDDLATRHAPRARQLIRYCLYSHLAASVLAAAAAVSRVEGGLAIGAGAIDVLVLIAAFTMLWFRGRSYEKWLLHRAETEVCRSFRATWDIRRHQRVSHQPHPSLPQLKELFQSLRLLRQLDQSERKTFEQARSDYEVNRIADQLGYFRRKHALASAEYASRKRLMAFSTAGAIACSIAVFLCAMERISGFITHPLEFLAISLPLATTALGLLLVTDESSRREIRYREMITAMEYYEPRVKACRTWHALARLATGVEEELLQEVLEWRSFVKHTEHLH